MNWLDVGLLIILVIAGFSGYKTGIIRGAVLFAGLVIGVILAGRVGGQLGEGLGLLGNDGSGRLLGFVLVFGICFVGAWILGIVIRKALHLLLLGWLDSLGGLLVGLISAAIFCTAIVVAMGSSSLPWATSAIQESKMGSFFASKGGFVMGLLPSKYWDALSFVSGVKQPIVTVASARVASVAAGDVTVIGALAVKNPNQFSGKISDVAYQLEWRDGQTWRPAGSIAHTTSSLDGNATQTVNLTVVVRKQEGADLAGLATALNASQTVPVRFKGTMDIAFPSKQVQVSFQDETTLQIGR